MVKREELSGGRIGKIYKLDGNVVRPSNEWTKDIHSFLDFIIKEGANFVPKPFGITQNGEEILSFMPGEIFNYPLPKELLEDEMIISAAKLLLTFHEYSGRYIAMLKNNEHWMLPTMFPIEVMCHGDFAPYNVTIVDDKAKGIIDFDTLHPGPKMWDVVYGVYRWIPFYNPNSPDSHGDLAEKIRRTKLFLDTYGADAQSRKLFTSLLVKRLNNLTDFMRHEANSGNKDFQLNIEAGHLQQYLDDIEYINANEAQIIKGIL